MLVVEKGFSLMKLKYFSELKRSMEYLAKQKTYHWSSSPISCTAMYNTLSIFQRLRS